MLNLSFRAIVVAFALVGATSLAEAATFDLARRQDGTVVQGLRIEGDIVPGDAQRLLDFYSKYGTQVSPVYLRSRGGDVEEAMRMGTIIRRLRLETSVPIWDTGTPPVDLIKVDHQEDTICASACFLVYAAGATRFGNYLALHRPYLAREEARSLSDVEYVALQKEMTTKVKSYLSDMDIDQYWIDRMFASNSQEGYMPSWSEADNKIRHLMDMVPSLEEVVLSKCKEDPDVDKKLQAFRQSRTGPLTDADIKKMKQIMQKADVFDECKKKVLSDMQDAAFVRENETAADVHCEQFPKLTEPELSQLKTLVAKGQNLAPDQIATRTMLLNKYMPSQQCRNEAIADLQMAAFRRWFQKAHQNQAASSGSSVATDFDAKELSAADMAKRGNDAYKAQQWDVAARWFRKAADLGNTDGMRGMSWIYGNGRGVPEDKTEALRWNRMAAEHGDSVATWLIGADYEEGRDVPRDYTEAMRWYRKAAEMGNGEGMLSVGQLYERGLGVPQDYGEAMRWFKKAADAGKAYGLVEVGLMYAYGYGVPKDEDQARFWMEKAVVSDDDSARFAANDWLVDHPSP